MYMPLNPSVEDLALRLVLTVLASARTRGRVPDDHPGGAGCMSYNDPSQSAAVTRGQNTGVVHGCRRASLSSRHADRGWLHWWRDNPEAWQFGARGDHGSHPLARYGDRALLRRRPVGRGRSRNVSGRIHALGLEVARHAHSTRAQGRFLPLMRLGTGRQSRTSLTGSSGQRVSRGSSVMVDREKVSTGRSSKSRGNIRTWRDILLSLQKRSKISGKLRPWKWSRKETTKDCGSNTNEPRSCGAARPIIWR